jgi:hypothetical protein
MNRAMTRNLSFSVLCVLVFVGVLAVAGCGGSGKKATGVFAVKKGMTQEQVRKLAGLTYAGSGPNCWLYRVIPTPSSAVDGMRFCFTNGRVSRIQTAVHG